MSLSLLISSSAISFGGALIMATLACAAHLRRSAWTSAAIVEESHAVVASKSNNRRSRERPSGRFTRLYGLSFLLADLHPHGALKPDDPNASDILHGPNERRELTRRGRVTWGKTMIWRSTIHSESYWATTFTHARAINMPRKRSPRLCGGWPGIEFCHVSNCRGKFGRTDRKFDCGQSRDLTVSEDRRTG